VQIAPATRGTLETSRTVTSPKVGGGANARYLQVLNELGGLKTSVISLTSENESLRNNVKQLQSLLGQKKISEQKSEESSSKEFNEAVERTAREMSRDEIQLLRTQLEHANKFGNLNLSKEETNEIKELLDSMGKSTEELFSIVAEHQSNLQSIKFLTEQANKLREESDQLTKEKNEQIYKNSEIERTFNLEII